MSSVSPPPAWAQIVVVAGTTATLAWWLFSSSKDWYSGPVRETDFESFLVQQTGKKTGVPLKRNTGWRGPKAASSERGSVSGPFESFLKREVTAEDTDEDPRNPLDFNSFLRSALPSQRIAATPLKSVATVTPHPGPAAHHVRIRVLYGTEFGFSKEVAERLCSRLRETEQYWPVLTDMADHPEGLDLQSEQVLLLACSTQGDGVPPTEAREFCDWLVAGKAGRLPGLHFSVCALGDRSYTHFCRCGQRLDNALAAQGSQRLAPRQDVNKEDWPVVEGWVQACLDGLARLSLRPVGSAAADPGPKVEAGSAAAPPAKRWGKARPFPGRVLAVEGLCAVHGLDDKNTFRLECDLGDSGLTYLPGDALGIYPRNDPKYVEELVEVMAADGSQLVPTPAWHYEDASHPGGKPDQLTLRDALAMCYDLRSPKPELLKLLSQALLGGEAAQQQGAAPGPPAKTLGVGSRSGRGSGALGRSAAKEGAGSDAVAAQAAALSSLLAGGSSAQESYLEGGRHVVDILRCFSAAHLNPSQVLGALRPLLPRLYSISSSPLEHPTRVQATIAEVKYKAHGAQRIGVCSTFVSERIQVGEQVPLYIHRNPDFRLPPALTTPIIMVGPGTGLAPFRSFILQRLLAAEQQQQQQEPQEQQGRQGGAGEGAGAPIPPSPGSPGRKLDGEGGEDVRSPAVGQMVLYFGCRRADQDYLYGPDLEQWAAQGKITLFTAFSRQQAAKVYVQDRLAQSADLVWALLRHQSAHCYVCGDAAHMAGAVEAALLDLMAPRLAAEDPALRAGGPAAAQAAAAAYLDQLAQAGRYQRDVWY
ncbi:sulfite reductase [Haematococcus lacustris]